MIVRYNQLDRIRKMHSNKEIAVCTGAFDLFHYSHLMLLKYIKEHTDILVVVVKSDKDVNAKGKKRPIINEYERAMIVDNIKFTDYTIVSDELHHSDLIDKLINENKYDDKEKYRLLRDCSIFEKIKADVLFVTEDKKASKVMEDFCEKTGMKIKTIPIQGNGFHTSDIINKIVG